MTELGAGPEAQALEEGSTIEGRGTLPSTKASSITETVAKLGGSLQRGFSASFLLHCSEKSAYCL